MAFVAAAVVAAGSIYGGISASAAKAKQQEAAQQAMAQAAAQYNGIIPPEVRSLIVEKLKKQGVYTPEIENAMSAGETHYKDIVENKTTTDAQQAALQQMAGVSRTGLQASDVAALNKIRNTNAQDVEGKNQQIQQQMQARGMDGSGSELAMQLANSQAGADRASTQSDDQAAQAQQNALRAISATSSMASQSRADDNKVASEKAQAQDEMNRFNVSNQRDVAAKNVASRNQAQAYNLADNQRIYEQNISNNRNEQLRQESAKQQQFNDQMSVASGRTAALVGVAKQANYMGQSQAESKQSMYSGIGNLAGKAIDAYNSPGSSTATNYEQDGLSVSDEGSGGDLGYATGGVVPGSASVPGDSPSNDTVKAKLSPGEIVIPRSASYDPEKAKAFVAKIRQPSFKPVPGVPAEKPEKVPSPAEPGPTDRQLAKHIVDSNQMLHSLFKRIRNK
jgi:hypothetical protein